MCRPTQHPEIRILSDSLEKAFRAASAGWIFGFFEFRMGMNKTSYAFALVKEVDSDPQFEAAYRRHSTAATYSDICLFGNAQKGTCNLVPKSANSNKVRIIEAHRILGSIPVKNRTQHVPFQHLQVEAYNSSTCNADLTSTVPGLRHSWPNGKAWPFATVRNLTLGFYGAYTKSSYGLH